VSDLLAAYDEQLRRHVPSPLPTGVSVSYDGPLVRLAGFAGRGFVGYRDLDGAPVADVDALIARQVAFFRERGESFEWKLHGHDRPGDLPARLLRAGFVPEERETVVVAHLERVPLGSPPPAGVELREVTGRADLERIAVLHEAVPAGDGTDASALVDDLERELAADPGALVVVLAEAGAEVVAAAWVRFVAGTEFATFWGGATRPSWRRRGIYRALVAHRARLAVHRGARYLQVDASEESRPILERLGFVAVTTTTPYVWSP
jgi:GNAT superfamily N-acetyltransferase